MSTPTVDIQPVLIKSAAAETWAGLGATAEANSLEEGNLAATSAGITLRASKSACWTPWAYPFIQASWPSSEWSTSIHTFAQLGCGAYALMAWTYMLAMVGEG